MTTKTIQRKLNRGYRQHLAGDTQSAAQAYSEILLEDPTNSEAWHLSGLLAFQKKRFSDAEQMIHYALELSPGNIAFQANLAAVLLATGRDAEAEALCRTVLKRHPDYADALKHLATSLRNQDRIEEALSTARKLVSILPRDLSALCNLGAILNDAGRLSESHAALIGARQLDESRPEVHLNLGAVQRRLGHSRLALQSLNRAVELDPARSEAYTNRGNLLLEMNHPAQAVQDYQQALELNPRSIAALSGLGQSLPVLGHWDEAMEAVRLASQLAAGSSRSGGASLTASLRRRMMSNLLYCASLAPGLNRNDVFEMHAHWGRSIEQVVPPMEHLLAATPEKRLRIGYVSPDFRGHATMRFFFPFFDAHDREQFDICCYSECAVADDFTEHVKTGSTLWRDTHGISDQRLAETIRNDQIDILVDLAGHTAGNRLPVFACRPAPVQVSFLGYPNTTGLSRVDYLLVDAIREDGSTACYFTEQLVAMPHGACCFQPLSEDTPVSDPPCLRNGFITLGSTHRLEKLSLQCRRMWASVLQQIPNARLRIIRDVLGTGELVRARVLQQLSEAGIDPQRVDLVGEIPANHLRVYSDVDILLDVFPWPSGTTIYESLWMGVPMATIADRSTGSSASASCLHHVGCHDLIGRSTDEYLQIVAALASNTDRLVQLRRTLRDQMRNTVCNGPRFCRDLESVFRSMWRRYCGTPPEQAGLPLMTSSGGQTS